jgi:hypothetical protein
MPACHCKPRRLFVVARKCNRSVRCQSCGAAWRTRAKYADPMPDAPSVWMHQRFENAKSHAAPAHLYDAVVADMRARGAPPRAEDDAELKSLQPIAEWGFDPGGMALIDAQRVEVKLDGLAVSFVAWDHDLFMGALKKALEGEVRRTPAGDPYVKVHGRWQVLVLAPEQAHRLLNHLRAAEKEAEEKAKIDDARIKANAAKAPLTLPTYLNRS